MKTYNWEGVNPDGYFLDKLEPIPSALPSFQKLFQVSATALSKIGRAVQQECRDRKSGSAGMPRPTSYAVFCSKKNMQHRAVGLQRIGEPQCARQRPIVDHDHPKFVLGEITLSRDNNRDRLTDIT